MDDVPQGSALKKRHHIKTGGGRKAEYPMNPDDGGMFQRSDQPGFPDELVDGFGKEGFRVFIQRNQAMGVGISGAKSLGIMFLEDDLSVQRCHGPDMRYRSLRGRGRTQWCKDQLFDREEGKRGLHAWRMNNSIMPRQYGENQSLSSENSSRSISSTREGEAGVPSRTISLIFAARKSVNVILLSRALRSRAAWTSGGS